MLLSSRCVLVTALLSLLPFPILGQQPVPATQAADTQAKAKTFMDYFLPTPPHGVLSRDAWGSPNVLPRDPQNGLEDTTLKQYCYWDGQIVKAPDGKYHLFASRWDESRGHGGWFGSVAVHAVSDSLTGPYVDKGLCWPNDAAGRGHNVTALTLVPHWNWAGKEGTPIKVMALTNADAVSLSLNGKLIEEKPVDKSEMVSWDVPYAPGRIEALAKKDGKVVARYAVETTGEPVALRLTPDRKTLVGNGNDALPVTVESLDSDGRPVPTANLTVEFEISGPGAIIGLGNGDPTSHEPEKGNRRRLFNGLAQVILQSQRGGSGNLVLRAKAEGLKPAETTISVAALSP